MKKSLSIILACIPVLLSSCVIQSTRKDGPDPEYECCRFMFHEVLGPVLMAEELVLFFDSYQDIRSDRSKSLALFSSMFGPLEGSYGELYYESSRVLGRGKVTLISKGDYRVSTDSWPAIDMNAHATEGNVMTMSTDDGSDVTIEKCIMHVEGNCIVTELKLRYCESDGTMVSVSTKDGHPLRKALPDGKTYYTPSEGILDITLEGDGGTDRFQLEFDGPEMEFAGGIYPGRYDAYFIYSDPELYKEYE